VAEKPDEADLLTAFFGRSLVALELAAESREFKSSIAAIALSVEMSLHAGGKLIIAGNGAVPPMRSTWLPNFFRDFCSNGGHCRPSP
jgi:hypothetical protein